MNDDTPLTIDVSPEVLDDLAWRLGRARWPAQLLLAGGEDAGRLRALQGLLERWRDGFDWREQERQLNARLWLLRSGARPPGLRRRRR